MFGLGLTSGSGCTTDSAGSPCRAPVQILTRPFGVWKVTATMPGVPLGATHSTLTSSSGRSTGWPSHAEPATAELGARAHGLAERCLVRRRVVEHLYQLEIGPVRQRHDAVAGAETGVHTTVLEVLTEKSGEALSGAGESAGPGGEDDV